MIDRLTASFEERVQASKAKKPNEVLVSSLERPPSATIRVRWDCITLDLI